MRLITRADFDGLACGALLLHMGLIDDWQFVHPKDMQDGKVEVTDNDILANIPYVKGCKLWFDHHSSESERMGIRTYFEGVSRIAPSCARVIYEFYGGDEKLGRFSEMIRYVDKVDSGDLIPDEILHPHGWILLGFIMDPRTGLSRFRDFAFGLAELMKDLAHACISKNIDEILVMPKIKERVEVYREQSALYLEMIKKYARTEDNVMILDLRGVETIHAGNRFLIYTMFPEQNISIWAIDGKDKVNVAITVGYSIINRSAEVNVGSLMLQYGGGGHRQVGTCQVPYAEADRVMAEIIAKLK